MWALLLVTYPVCNRGESCREIVATFNDFDHMVEYCDSRAGAVAAESRSCNDDVRVPGWDYLEVEELS